MDSRQKGKTLLAATVDKNDSAANCKAVGTRKSLNPLVPHKPPQALYAPGQSSPGIVRLQRAFLRWFAYSWLSAVGSRLCVRIFKCVPALSLAVVIWRSRRVWLLLKKMEKSAVLFCARTSLELWALMEVGFWFYFRWKKRELEDRRAYQPSVLWKARGERLVSLQKVLASVEHIHTGDGFIHKQEAQKQAPSNTLSNTVRVSQRRLSATALSVKESARTAMGALFKSPSVEHFLRYQSKRPNPVGLQQSLQQDQQVFDTIQRKKSLKSMSTSPSVANILRCWSAEDLHGSVMGGQMSSQDDSAIRALKQLELCSWFTITKPVVEVCTNIAEVRRGNIEEWILSYWFDGADGSHAQELTVEELAEVNQLTDEVIRWAGLSASLPYQDPESVLFQDRNPRLRCFRMRNDPFPAVHRPLFCYVATAFLAPLAGHRSLAALGFRPYRSGSMEYWFRPVKVTAFPKSGRPRRPTLTDDDIQVPEPIVFVHGIGIGPTMCLSFVQQLVKNMGETTPMFVVDVGAISMRFVDDVPSGSEVSSNIANMLEVWGFQQAHFISHSFGSFVFAWMMRYQRSYVERATCIDPVCFLTLKMFKEVYELQQLRTDSAMNTMEMATKYFVATELWVCNFCCRCFFWEESQLDMRDLDGLPTLVVLEEEDLIVQVHSVRRLVLAEQHRRARKAGSVSEALALELLWLEGQPHAGFLADAETNQEINARLQRFHMARTRADTTVSTGSIEILQQTSQQDLSVHSPQPSSKQDVSAYSPQPSSKQDLSVHSPQQSSKQDLSVYSPI